MTAITEKIEIPGDIVCTYTNKIIHCKKDSIEISKKFDSPLIEFRINSNAIILESRKSDKRRRKTINSFIAHIKNIFQGLDRPYQYKLEACNVHFPMSLKIEGSKLAINNFLGEKTPRYAEILPNVNVLINGTQITLSSPDKEAAGQTASNMELATKVKNRDRRIFQDGIYIVSKQEDKK